MCLWVDMCWPVCLTHFVHFGPSIERGIANRTTVFMFCAWVLGLVYVDGGTAFAVDVAYLKLTRYCWWRVPSRLALRVVVVAQSGWRWSGKP